MPEADDWGVLVDELKIFATGSPGSDWWALYVSRQPDERVTYLAMTPSGGHVHVACDSKDDAEMLLGTITNHGVNPKLVKVATLEACQNEAGRRAERQATAGARQAEWDESHREFYEAWHWWVNNVQPDPLTDAEGSRRALAEIGYPSSGFQDVVLRLYRDHKANLERPAPVPTGAGETPTTITKSTPELQAGDVILDDGMRVRIEQLMRTSHSPGARCDAWYRSEHKVPPSEVWATGIARNDGHGEACRVTYAWDGRVLNTAEVREAGVVPAHFLYDEARHTRGPGHGREDQWTVQGNDLDTWTVELAAAGAATGRPGSLPSETARAAQVRADTRQTAIGAGGQRPGRSRDFLNGPAKGASGRSGARRRTTGQPSGPAPPRTP